jgi:hypothetical protein
MVGSGKSYGTSLRIQKPLPSYLIEANRLSETMMGLEGGAGEVVTRRKQVDMVAVLLQS